MKKYIFSAVFSLILLASPVFTQAAGLSSSQIQSILSLLASFGADSATISSVNTALTGGTAATPGASFCYNFTTDLTVGSKGPAVTALNKALEISGIETMGDASVFDENKAGYVVSFQAKYGIRQTGYVGPLTRAKLNSLYKCSTVQPTVSVAAPTCTLASKPYSVISGETTTLIWTSQNASYATWEQNSSANVLGLSSDKLSANGSQTITVEGGKGNQNPTLLVYGLNGSSSCNTTVSIETPVVTTTEPVATPTATLDSSSLTTTSNHPRITGTVHGVNAVGLSIGNNGGKFDGTGTFNTDQYGNWGVTLNNQTYEPGTYQIDVYSDTNVLLTSGMLTVKAVTTTPAPVSLSLSPSTCVVAANANACALTASWSNPDGKYLNVYNSTRSFSHLYTYEQSGSRSIPVPYSGGISQTIQLRDGSTTAVLDSRTVPVSCTTGTSWNGSLCAAPVTVTSTPVTIIISTSSGSVTNLIQSGVSTIVKGNSGVDIVNLTAGASVDGTQLGLGQDEIRLAGAWGDYAKTYSGSVVTLTRSARGYTETVKFLGGSATAYDSIVFIDGTAKSVDILNYLKGTATTPVLY